MPARPLKIDKKKKDMLGSQEIKKRTDDLPILKDSGTMHLHYLSIKSNFQPMQKQSEMSRTILFFPSPEFQKTDSVKNSKIFSQNAPQDPLYEGMSVSASPTLCNV